MQCLQAGHETSPSVLTEDFVGLNATKPHIANIMGKLRLRNRVEVAIYARQQEEPAAGPFA